MLVDWLTMSGNPAEYMDYNFSYDVIKDSLEILRESEQTVA